MTMSTLTAVFGFSGAHSNDHSVTFRHGDERILGIDKFGFAVIEYRARYGLFFARISINGPHSRNVDNSVRSDYIERYCCACKNVIRIGGVDRCGRRITAYRSSLSVYGQCKRFAFDTCFDRSRGSLRRAVVFELGIAPERFDFSCVNRDRSIFGFGQNVISGVSADEFSLNVNGLVRAYVLIVNSAVQHQGHVVAFHNGIEYAAHLDNSGTVVSAIYRYYIDDA